MEPSSAEESLSTVPWTCAGEIPIVKSVQKFFAGHFFDPEATVLSSVPAMKQPPSVILKKLFHMTQSFKKLQLEEQPPYHCCICGGKFEEQIDYIEFWICCD